MSYTIVYIFCKQIHLPYYVLMDSLFGLWRTYFKNTSHRLDFKAGFLKKQSNMLKVCAACKTPQECAASGETFSEYPGPQLCTMLTQD